MHKYKAKNRMEFRADGKRYSVQVGEIFETNSELSRGCLDWAEKLDNNDKKIKGDG